MVEFVLYTEIKMWAAFQIIENGKSCMNETGLKLNEELAEMLGFVGDIAMLEENKKNLENVLHNIKAC